MRLLKHSELVYFLIALCLTSSLHAKPNELALRLAQLSLDPANDPRFNDIHSVDISKYDFPKEQQNVDKLSVFPGTVADADENADTKTVEGDPQQPLQTTTPGEGVDGEDNAETQRGAVRALVTTMLNFMGGVMRRLFTASDN